jgi:hypothetical protein
MPFVNVILFSRAEKLVSFSTIFVITDERKLFGEDFLPKVCRYRKKQAVWGGY